MKLECVGHSFAYVARFVVLKDVRIQTQRATVASMRAASLAIHLSNVILVRNILKPERSEVVFDFHFREVSKIHSMLTKYRNFVFTTFSAAKLGLTRLK